VENAEDAALRPRHPTPLRTTRRVVIIAAIANGEESSNARRVASSSVATMVARAEVEAESTNPQNFTRNGGSAVGATSLGFAANPTGGLRSSPTFRHVGKSA
jgi:hypothetical protein